MQKTFRVEVVLSIITGILLCNMKEIYDICNHITGDKLYTHQLSRASNFCVPFILAQYPMLCNFTKDINKNIFDNYNTMNFEIFIEYIKKEIGANVLLDSTPEGVWSEKNPIEEIFEISGNDNIIVTKF